MYMYGGVFQSRDSLHWERGAAIGDSSWCSPPTALVVDDVVPTSASDFMNFYTARRERMRSRLATLLTKPAPSIGGAEVVSEPA